MDVVYASFNAGPNLFSSDLWAKSLGRLFYIFYNDRRGLPLVDDRTLVGSNSDTGSVSIHTVGADYVRMVQASPGLADLLVWTVAQFGSWGRQNQRAYAAVAEAVIGSNGSLGSRGSASVTRLAPVTAIRKTRTMVPSFRFCRHLVGMRCFRFST